MNRTQRTSFILSNLNYPAIDKPIFCPHCQSYADVTPVASSTVEHGNLKLVTIIYSPACCRAPFFAVYIKGDGGGLNLATIYPNTFPSALSQIFKDTSPNFVKLYEQAAFAEDNGYFELSATGYRNALEILIKDFAMASGQATLDKVCDYSLAEAISKFMPTTQTRVAADVIRIIGNDFTHYKTKYDNVSFSDLKRYIMIFVQFIEVELLILNPAVPTRHSS